ncbi:DDE-type integrase/transposase/recombinase [Hydrogenophaga palleronii]|uniref:DDE-type integrase/transposase/recombinase n=1 Tax=Hydrogenophaga palleronii TaxID=65655 RepID=UPI0008267F53|nr:DDE-type integrase/transposase/recombinase [Hydrogenophaga palleronii]
MNQLSLGDKLVDPRTQNVTMAVTSSTPTMGRIRVLEIDADTERWIPHEELRHRISAGNLEVQRAGNPALTTFFDRSDAATRKHQGARHTSRGVAQEHYLTALERATRIVRELNEYCKRHRVSAYAAYPIVRQRFDNEYPGWIFPSMATAYRLLERDKCNAPLLMPNHVRGNRSERYSPALIELICTLGEEHYCEQHSKWNLKALTDLCRRTAIQRELLSAKASLSQKFVRKIIVTRLHSMPEVQRHLAKDRAAKASVASRRIQVDGLLQRVEQDTLHLPFVIRTPDGVCSDVNLAHAIDCGSSIVTGWHLKIGTLNESDGLRCIESILFSKGPSFKYLDIDDALDLYGTPALLVLDNGAETRGDRIRRLTQLGVDVHYCKARNPQEKPFIERLNRSLKEALELLPGCTRLNGLDGQRDPVALGDDLMTFEELKRWIARWYYEKWADTVLKRFVDEEVCEESKLGVTPRQRYENIFERLGHALPLPPNKGAWIRTKYNAVRRKLSRKSGVTHDTYDFKGDNLEFLLERFGQEPVDVLFDPEDYRRVYVVDGTELVELTNEAANEFSPAYSFEYAKEHRAAIKAANPESARSASFTESVYDRSMRSSSAANKSKKSPGRREKREVVQKAKHREAVARASKTPLLPSKPKTPALNNSMATWDDVDELSPRNRNTGALI